MSFRAQRLRREICLDTCLRLLPPLFATRFHGRMSITTIGPWVLTELEYRVSH